MNPDGHMEGLRSGGLKCQGVDTPWETIGQKAGLDKEQEATKATLAHE